MQSSFALLPYTPLILIWTLQTRLVLLSVWLGALHYIKEKVATYVFVFTPIPIGQFASDSSYCILSTVTLQLGSCEDAGVTFPF